MMTLNQIEPGGKCRITQIKVNSPIAMRLLEMGLVTGEIVQKVKLAPLADPAEYIVKGYHISLRKEEAQNIVVENL